MESRGHYTEWKKPGAEEMGDRNLLTILLTLRSVWVNSVIRLQRKVGTIVFAPSDIKYAEWRMSEMMVSFYPVLVRAHLE